MERRSLRKKVLMANRFALSSGQPPALSPQHSPHMKHITFEIYSLQKKAEILNCGNERPVLMYLVHTSQHPCET